MKDIDKICEEIIRKKLNETSLSFDFHTMDLTILAMKEMWTLRGKADIDIIDSHHDYDLNKDEAIEAINSNDI